MAPSCHPLAYFSGTPLRFDYDGDLFGWPTGSFTFTSSQVLVGTVQGHRIYQVLQDVRRKPSTAPAGVPAVESGRIKRLVVERKAGDFCLIFQEEDFYRLFYGFWPAQLVTIQGEPILRTADPLSGNGGFVEDESWTFHHGVPALLDPYSAIHPVVEKLVPKDCEIRKGDPWDLLTLSYQSRLWRSRDDMADPTCGSISIRLAFKHGKLVVAAAKYSPAP